MYVFWFSEFPLQNYFHIKKGNGQVDSENIAGNKVEKKQLFCQLDFGTAEERKKKLFLSDIQTYANLCKTLTTLPREQEPTQKR